MNRAAGLVAGLTAIALTSISAQAQEQGYYQVLIDADGDPSTGCSIQPAGGDTLAGHESRLVARVDINALEIVDVERQTCREGVFNTDDSGGEDYPVALNTGTSGSDSIELAADRDALGLAGAPELELAFVADTGNGSDVVTTVSGFPGGAPIGLGLPIQIPVLSPWALAGLAIALVGLAWLAHRRLGRVGTVCVVMGVATLTWAMQFAADGDLSDWSGHSPAATDPPGDATDGRSTADLLAAFAAVENGILYFRLDVADLENRPPEADNDTYMVNEDTVIDVSAPGVLSNDSDADADALAASLETGPEHAANFTLNADGGFSYEPEPDFNGEDAFTYLASDGDLDSNPANVTITVSPVNDAPQADDLTVTTDEDVALTIQLTGSDPEDDTLQFATVDGPDNGSLGALTGTGDASAEVTYTPNADFNGTDNFTFTADDGSETSDPATVTITVEPVNDPPAFTAGGDVTVDEDSDPYSQVWASDVSPGPDNESGQTLQFEVTADDPSLFASGPSINAATGELAFTPAADANGSTEVTVVLTDDGGSANGGDDTADPATFAIAVEAVNDSPSFIAGGDVTVDEDSGPYGQVWASDVSRGPDNESGQTLQFEVTADDPSLFASGPSINAATGELAFTPAADANGSTEVTVVLTDDGGTANGGDDSSDPATFALTVEAVNDPPSFIAGGDVTVDEDSGPYSQVWASDVSPGPDNESGQTLQFEVTADDPSLFASGPSIDAATGELGFTPAADANGSTEVTVVLTDDGGTANGGDDTADPATFTLTVEPVNDPPQADDASATTNEDTSLEITMTGSDIDGDDLAFTIDSGPANGSLGPVSKTGAESATIEYQPDPDFNGNDGFDFTVDDGNATSTATVSISVSPVNDPPVPTGGPFSVAENSVDGTSVGTVLANDPDTGQTHTFVITGGNTGGAFTINAATGEITVATSSALDFETTPSFSLTVDVTDDETPGLTGSTTVTVNLTDVNDPPEANADAAAITEEAPNTTNDNTVSGNVLANDTDQDSSITVFAVDGASGNVGNSVAVSFGSVTINADGSYTYWLDDNNASVDGLAPGETLTDSIDYTAWDGSLADTTTLSVTIDGADDPAVAFDDEFTGIENTDCLLITPLDNDIDPDGGFQFELLSVPAVGTLHEVENDGTAGDPLTPGLQDSTEFCFVPEPYDYSNPADQVYAQFDYRLNPGGSEATVDIFIHGAPEPPTADNQSLDVDENSDTDITLTGSDSDGDTLTFELDTPPQHGAVTGLPASDPNSVTITYTPDTDYTGADSFSFTTDDGTSTSAPATVSLEVLAPVNTPPSVEMGGVTLVGPQTDPQPGTLEIDLAGDAALDTSYADPEAVTSTGTAFTDFHFRIAVLSIPDAAPFDPVDPGGNELDPFEWSLLDPEGSVSSVQIDPDFNNGDFGYMQWTSSLGQGNDLINGLELTLNAPGEYRVEFVVLDNGRLGTCGGDLEVPPPATAELDDKDIRFTIGRNGDLINNDPDRCNRESRGDIILNNNAGESVVVEIAPPPN